MNAFRLGLWSINVTAQAAGRYWLNLDGSGGVYTGSGTPYDVTRIEALKLAWVSNGAKSGGATGINLSLFDLDDAGNILEQLQLGAPTDIGSAAQAGYLLVGRQLASASPSSKVQLYQRQLIYAAAAVDVVGGAVTWAGRFELWGIG